MPKEKHTFTLSILPFWYRQIFIFQLRARQFPYGGPAARSWKTDSQQLENEVLNRSSGHFPLSKSTKRIE
jgi:hypothetical protein